MSDKPQLSMEETKKQYPKAILVLHLTKGQIYGGTFYFNFPLFCVPLENGKYEVETDIIVDNKKIRRLRFPQMEIIYSEEEINMQVTGETIFELLEEVAEGRTEEAYFNARKSSKTENGI